MAILVGIGLSKNRDSYLAGKEAAHSAKQKIDSKNISLAFVFATTHFKLEQLLAGIKEILGNTPVVGSSGVGIITPSGIDSTAAAVMLISSTKVKFAIAKETDLDKKDLHIAGQKLAKAALQNLGAAQREVFILFLDGLIKNGSSLISGIKETLGISFPLIGGSSGDDLKFTKTYQFFRDECLTNSAVATLIGGDATVRIGIRHGWKPLGKPRTVTSSAGNIIKTIDDKPALSLYEEYFGKNNPDIRSGKLMHISVRYPLGIYLEGEEEYLLRNALWSDKDGSLICQGDVPQGATLKLMMGTKESALKAAALAAETIKEMSKKNRPLKFALIFDSFSRNRLLGRNAQDEIKLVKNILGSDIPFIGFYSYGEQAPLSSLDYRGQAHFHNESIAILGVGEQQ